jgi:hypothetical protein
MTKQPSVHVVRTPYEEPYHAHVTISASNGAFCGETDFYCNVDDLLEIGRALSQFPAKIPDSYEFVYGSANRADRLYRLLRMRVSTLDMAGHCALHFEIDLNEDEPNEGRAAFSLAVDPWALGELGRLFQKLHGEPSGEFRWTPIHGAVAVSK